MILLRKFSEVTDHSGLTWYNEAHEFCRLLSEKYNESLVTVCAVMSALSPGTNWEQNKKDTIAILERKRKYKCTTYGQNVRKAREILSDGIPRFNPKTGAKTYNFFHLLVEPDNSLFVCIDRHAFTIATDEIYTGLRGKQYSLIAKRYIRAAKKIGLLPSQLQAILWVDYRIKNDIKFEPVPF
jgi:hypothetical protein